ncbi:hypothetical protein PMAYCL1PPCAC_25367 [Pristionchus mayeri]|uniref:BTB domain-containing protein n=1 Tax=Pristionchus mayeri TaxID=1317129 RepID=A0AAN5D321_9BILA|nr:hypothetical protein PMAYCL1PPCAC_25367 [Pristionchus mayeri]
MRYLILALVCAASIASISLEEEFDPNEHPWDLESDSETATVRQVAAEVYKYAAPNGMSNVTLVFGDKKLVVSRGFLAVQSSIFADMVTEGSGQEDVMMDDDVQYDEFVSFLDMVFPGELHGQVSDENVRNLVHLGQKFAMKHIENNAEKFLIKSDGFKISEKLLLADQYWLRDLQAYCLHSYSCLVELGKLKDSTEYSFFSLLVKAAILDRMMELTSKRSWWC